MFLGFPTLGAMGLAKYANLSTVFGTVIQPDQPGNSLFHRASRCADAVPAHVPDGILILLFRVVVIFLNRNRLRPEEAGKIEEKILDE